MKAVVIFINDEPVLVVHPNSDQSKIKQKIEELAKSHYEKVKFNFSNYTQYRNRMYWHTHEVVIEKL